MLPQLSKIKGIHPGAILRRELKLQNLKGTDLAVNIGEHKQTISAILNKRRSINPKLSIKLARLFGAEEDYFMLVQSSYDVKLASEIEPQITPDYSKIRKAVFWDTTIDKIDWIKNKRAVIQRVLERGNSEEVREILSFYGKEIVIKEVKTMEKSRLASFEKNMKEHGLTS